MSSDFFLILFFLLFGTLGAVTKISCPILRSVWFSVGPIPSGTTVCSAYRIIYSHTALAAENKSDCCAKFSVLMLSIRNHLLTDGAVCRTNKNDCNKWKCSSASRFESWAIVIDIRHLFFIESNILREFWWPSLQNLGRQKQSLTHTTSSKDNCHHYQVASVDGITMGNLWLPFLWCVLCCWGWFWDMAIPASNHYRQKSLCTDTHTYA